MAEIEQLYTAIPFGEGELSDELREQLRSTEPAAWIASFAAMLNIVFSIVLAGAGMALLQRAPKAPMTLVVWSVAYILFSICASVVNWVPRMELVQQVEEIEGMFLAQIFISMPLYFALPIFLLIYLNRKQTRNEVASWR
jgi:hypothetical protein